MVMQNYRPRLYCLPVTWELPEEEWIKYNTDGGCKGNPGQSSYAFCIRDWQGDILYTEAKVIGEMSKIG